MTATRCSAAPISALADQLIGPHKGRGAGAMWPIGAPSTQLRRRCTYPRPRYQEQPGHWPQP